MVQILIGATIATKKKSSDGSTVDDKTHSLIITIMTSRNTIIYYNTLYYTIVYYSILYIV